MKRKALSLFIFFMGLFLISSNHLYAIMAADFENNSVTYPLGGTGSPGTRYIASNSSVNHKNGNRSLQFHYKLTNALNRWFWCRGTFSAAQDWRNTTTIRFWLKGDGSQNLISFKFTASGGEYAHLGSEVISLINTNWQKVEIPLGQCKTNGIGSPPPQGYLASVSDFVISLNGNSTNVYHDIFIDDMEVLDPRPQVMNLDNANMEVYNINPGGGGDIISVSNSATIFQEGIGSLKMTYAPLVSWAFAEVTVYTQDWSTNSGVSFYLRGNGNADTTFNFEINASGNNFNRDQIPLTSTSWRKITLRFSDLKLNGVGAAPTPNDLKKVSIIRFILNESIGGTTGSLYLDDLRLLARTDPNLIDDYENLFASYTIYGNPGVISCSNLPNDFHEGAQSLKINYNLGLGAWGGLRRDFNPTNNFNKGNALSFWLKGDGSTNIFKVQIGTPDATNPAGGYYWRYFIPLNDTSWHHVWVPFREFTDNTPKAPSLSGLTKVSNYWFFIDGSGGTGTIYVDDMRLITMASNHTPWEWVLNKQSGVSYLIDSFDDTNSANYSGWIYDQVLAAIAMVSKGSNERAKWLFKTLQYRQEANGSFVTVYDPYTGKPDNSTKHITGNNAWVIIAINYYTYKTGDTEFLSVATKCADRLLTYQGPDGCFSMGPEPPYNTRYSTENNIDCFSAFYYLSFLSGNNTYKDAAMKVLGWLQSSAWDQFDGYFYEGKNDSLLALDPNSFGILTLGITGPNGSDYTRSLNVCYSNLRLVDSGREGFTFDKSTVTSPGCVWLEGTTSMAMAYYYAGQIQKAQYFFTQVSNSIRPNGGLAYTTKGNLSGDVNTNNAMSTACWYVLYNQTPKVNPLQLYSITLPNEGGLPSTYGRLPVIDDFEDGLLDKNNLGLQNSHSDNVTNELVTNTRCGGRQALKIKYDTSSTWAAWWTFLNCDISAYKDLTFCVRGEKPGNQFTVTFNDEKEAFHIVQLNDFLPFGVSDQWQTVSIPLRTFIDFRHLDFRHITTLSFTFSGKDILYLDEIKLVPYESVMDKSFGQGDVFSRVLLDKNRFSPNGDGLNETICLSMELRNEGTMELEVYDMKGSLVRKFSQEGVIAEFCWDGRDKDNRLLNNGLYIYQISGKDRSGKEEKFKKLILLEK